MLEDLITVGRMNKACEATRERNTCMGPSYKAKTVEDPATPSHVEEKIKHT